jgi:hypothetical protein
MARRDARTRWGKRAPTPTTAAAAPATVTAAPVSPALSRAVVGLAWLALLACVTAMTVFTMSNNDIWIHLKTGEYVLRNGWVPIKDPYSFTASDHDYVAHEWLAGVLFYLVYAPFGVTGLIVFKSAIVAAACAFLYGVARILGARFSVMLPAFAVLLYLGSARYIERPHVFSYLMAAVYLWLFFRYRDGGDRRWLYLMLPADVAWTNLHGGYVQGLAMVATFALGEGLNAARARLLGVGRDQALPPRDLLLLAALVPGCAAASLLNPYGYRALTFPFELTGLELFMQRIYEWQPPYHDVYNASTMYVLYLGWVGALWAAFFLRYREHRAPAWLRIGNGLLLAALAVIYLLLVVFWFQQPPVNWQPDVLARIMYVLLGLLCAFTAANLRSVDFTHAGLIALLYLMSLRHNRAVTDAAMGTFVTLTASASAVLDRRLAPGVGVAQKAADRSSPLGIALGAALLLAVATHATVYAYYFDFKGTARERGLGIAETMPTCAVDFIERVHLTGNAFVTYTDAALLIHRMHPEVKVNMDSRNDVYGEALYSEYLAALAGPEGMQAYLRNHRVDFFLLSYPRRIAKTFDQLESSGEWAPVYYDDAWFILARRTPETRALLEREAFRVLRPYELGAPEVTTANAPVLLEEVERTIRNCPKAVLGHFLRNDALRSLGRHEEAIAEGREVLARVPGNFYAYADLAESYAALGQRERAIEMLETALRLNPWFKPARDALRQLRGG